MLSSGRLDAPERLFGRPHLDAHIASLPAMPACPQSCTWLRRMMWLPMCSLSQCLAMARLMVMTYPSTDSDLLSHSSPYLPSVMPTHLEWLTSLSSITHPLLQCTPSSPICSAVGGAQGVAAWLRWNPFTWM